MYLELVKRLMEKYDLEEWWPTFSESEEKRKFEIIAGAILTSQASWSKAKKALKKLKEKGKLDPKEIEKEGKEKIGAELKNAEISYSYRKAEYLVKIAKTINEEYDGRVINVFLGNEEEVKEKLKELKGIGKTIAEQLLLYAGDIPYFPEDPSVKRFLERFTGKNYEEIKEEIREEFGNNTTNYKALHGLAFEHASKVCRKKPKCYECCVEDICNYESKNLGGENG